MLCIIYALTAVVPARVAALIVAAVLGIVATVLISGGLAKLNRISPFHDKSIETLKDNMKWAKSLTDWHTHFENNPMMMLGLAFGGGIMLASIVGGGSSRSRSRSERNGDGAKLGGLSDEMGETWNHIEGALVGMASGKVIDFLEDAVPGFQGKFGEHLKTGAVKNTLLPPEAKNPVTSLNN